MGKLKSKNIQRCLSLLEDFYGDVSVDDTNSVLKKKKANAQLALEHLAKIFAGNNVEAEALSVPCTRRARSC